jgi:hypothetical protein
MEEISCLLSRKKIKCCVQSKSKWILDTQYNEGNGHILCRNCLLNPLLKEVEDRIKVRGRRSRRHMQLIHEIREKNRY